MEFWGGENYLKATSTVNGWANRFSERIMLNKYIIMQRYKDGIFGGENYLKAFKRIVNIINQLCLIALKKNKVTLETFQLQVWLKY